MSRKRILVLALLFEGGLLGVSELVGAALGRSPLGDSPFSSRAILLGLAAALPLLALLGMAQYTSWAAVSRLKASVESIVEEIFVHTTTVDLLIISALAGLAEEAFFRGVVQCFLTEEFGIVVGVSVASLLFGLAHFISPIYALYATGVGMYLGLLLVVSGSLWMPIVAHASYDFFALAYLVHAVRNSKPAETRSPESTTGAPSSTVSRSDPDL